MLELILQKVRLLTANNPSFCILSDEVLLIYIEQAYGEAKSYCNVLELPDDVANTIALIVVNSLASGTSQIKSLSEGSRTVTYETPTTIQANYKKALDNYKVVRSL